MAGSVALPAPCTAPGLDVAAVERAESGVPQAGGTNPSHIVLRTWSFEVSPRPWPAGLHLRSRPGALLLASEPVCAPQSLAVWSWAGVSASLNQRPCL